MLSEVFRGQDAENHDGRGVCLDEGVPGVRIREGRHRVNPDDIDEHEVDGLLAKLSQYEYPLGSELALQNHVEEVLKAEGVAYKREHRFSATDRIDFLATEIGIECKVKGGPSDVLSQLLRYADRPEVSSVILLTTRHTHRFPMQELRGKPFRVLWVGGHP